MRRATAAARDRVRRRCDPAPACGRAPGPGVRRRVCRRATARRGEHALDGGDADFAGSVLSLASAGAAWRYARSTGGSKPSRARQRRAPASRRRLVCRSRTLAGNTTTLDGHPDHDARADPDRPRAAPARPRARPRGPRGVPARRSPGRATSSSPWPATAAAAARAGCHAAVSRYAGLPLHRTRSDAEALALELLRDAGRPRPAVNARIAGEEADLSWRGSRD